jgi:hypothetical protein
LSGSAGGRFVSGSACELVLPLRSIIICTPALQRTGSVLDSGERLTLDVSERPSPAPCSDACTSDEVVRRDPSGNPRHWAKCPLILGGHLLAVNRYGGVSGWHVPGQELCYAVDGVVGDTGEDVSQVAFRVDAVEIGCAEKRIDGSGPFSAAIGTGEEIVFSSERDDAQLYSAVRDPLALGAPCGSL